MDLAILRDAGSARVVGEEKVNAKQIKKNYKLLKAAAEANEKLQEVMKSESEKIEPIPEEGKDKLKILRTLFRLKREGENVIKYESSKEIENFLMQSWYEDEDETVYISMGPVTLALSVVGAGMVIDMLSELLDKVGQETTKKK